MHQNVIINSKRGDTMGINYKINVLSELKKAGYTTYRLKKEKIFGQQTIQKMRTGQVVYGTTLEKLCELLNCQVGDILEYIPVNPTEQEQAETEENQT